jgi:hypothetical protein
MREMVHHFGKRRRTGTAERAKIQALFFGQGDVVGAQDHGGFHVRGFDGETAADKLFHIHELYPELLGNLSC